MCHCFRDKLQDSQTTLSHLKKDEALMTEQELPRLLKDSAKTQLTQILSGDYNLKITRQDYFTSNQDKVCLVIFFLNFSCKSILAVFKIVLRVTMKDTKFFACHCVGLLRS